MIKEQSFSDMYDLGKHFENMMLKKIQNVYPTSFCFEGNIPYGDMLIPEIEKMLEVKSETLISNINGEIYSSNRFLIETFKDSGVMSGVTISKSTYWIQIDGLHNMFLTKTEAIRKHIRDNLDWYHSRKGFDYFPHYPANQGNGYTTYNELYYIYYDSWKLFSLWSGKYNDFNEDVIREFII